jgi:hypothetical protein
MDWDKSGVPMTVAGALELGLPKEIPYCVRIAAQRRRVGPVGEPVEHGNVDAPCRAIRS